MSTGSNSRDYTVLLLSEAVAPISHSAGSAGNEAIVAREPVVTDAGIRYVPYLSGNALRHRTVRAPGMDDLVRRYGLVGKLDLPTLNFLFHGGSLTEGGGREDTARIAEMQRTWPLLRLVGGSLPDQILAGSIQVWRGTLVCEENRPYLAAVLPDPTVLPKRLRPAEAFVSGYQYTRGDGRKSRSDLATAAARQEDAAGDGSNLMIFAGQAVTRGAVFLHGYDLPHASEVELGALLWSLRLWQAAGGTIGGQAARGHGRLRSALVAGDFDPESAVAAYLEHVARHQADAVAWLEAAFRKREKPAGKGKAKSKAAPEAAPIEPPSLLPAGE